ncbi:MAG: heavy metal sensor histidine kinase [Gemmatimonadaceae bacterium]
MPTWPASLRLRLTAWFTLVLGATLVAFAVGSYGIFARTLRERTETFTGDALTAFSRELAAERRMLPDAGTAARKTVEEVRFRDLQIVITDSAGRIVALGAGAQEPAHERDRLPLDVARLTRSLSAMPWAAETRTLPDAQGGFLVVARPFTLDGTPLRLAAVYPLHDVQTVLDRIRAAFLVVIPLLLAAAAAGGFFLARRGLAPVADMAARASRISASTLHERLPVGAAGDELAELATVVNGLLNRLEGSFAQQRRFMADASHELRTPTAILRTEADVTLARASRSEAEYRASFAVMQDAARRLTRIVDDLFLIARADAGHLVPRAEDLYLEEVVLGAVRGIRPIAEQRGVQVEVQAAGEAPMRGDADLLGRLVLNLLDNAVKFTPDGGCVEVEIARAGAACTVVVTDAGPGIPAEAQPRIFERFFRADTARSRVESSAMSGAGLGLAIARHIAQAHGGTLELAESRPGRTAFRASFPADGPSASG